MSQAQGAPRWHGTWGSANPAKPASFLNMEGSERLKTGLGVSSPSLVTQSSTSSRTEEDSQYSRCFERGSSTGSSTEGGSPCFEGQGTNVTSAEEEDPGVQIFFLNDDPSWPVPRWHTQGAPPGCTLAHDASHCPPQAPPSGPHYGACSDSPQYYGTTAQPGNGCAHVPGAGHERAGAGKEGPALPLAALGPEVSPTDNAAVPEYRNPCMRIPFPESPGGPAMGGARWGAEGGQGLAATVPASAARRRTRRAPGSLGVEALRKMTSLEVIVEGRQASLAAFPFPPPLPGGRRSSLSDAGPLCSPGGEHPGCTTQPGGEHPGYTTQPGGEHPGYTTQPGREHPRYTTQLGGKQQHPEYTTQLGVEQQHPGYTTPPTRGAPYVYTTPRSASLPNHSTSQRVPRYNIGNSNVRTGGALDLIHCSSETLLGTPTGEGAGSGPGGGRWGEEAELVVAWEAVPKGRARRDIVADRDRWREANSLFGTPREGGSGLADGLHAGIGLQGMCSPEPGSQKQPPCIGHRTRSVCSSFCSSSAYYSDTGSGEWDGDSDTSEGADFRGTHYSTPFAPGLARRLGPPKADSSARADSAVVEALARLACHDLSRDVSGDISTSGPSPLNSAGLRHNSLTRESHCQLAAAAGQICPPGPWDSMQQPLPPTGRRSLTAGSSADGRNDLGLHRSSGVVARITKSQSCQIAAQPPRGLSVCPRPILVSPDRRGTGAGAGAQAHVGPKKPLQRRVSFDERVAVITYN